MPLTHGRFLDPYFKSFWKIHRASATKSFARSRIFRYGMPKDILSRVLSIYILAHTFFLLMKDIYVHLKTSIQLLFLPLKLFSIDIPNNQNAILCNQLSIYFEVDQLYCQSTSISTNHSVYQPYTRQITVSISLQCTSHGVFLPHNRPITCSYLSFESADEAGEDRVHLGPLGPLQNLPKFTV